MKKIILIIIAQLLCEVALCQSNILPNGSFEFPLILSANGQNNCVPFANENASATIFNGTLNNWDIAEHNVGLAEGFVGLVQNNACTGGNTIPNSVKSFAVGPSPNGVHQDPLFFPNVTNKRFISLRADNRILTGPFGVVLAQPCQANRTSHGAIAIALENNATFPQGVTMVIRYKIVPGRGMKDNHPNEICNTNLFTHVRFFLSEQGPANWNKNSSDKQELISVNFTKNNSNNTLLSGNDLTILPGNWLQVERKFVPNQSNYTTLVVYMESGGCLIDDFEIFPECENTVTIQNKSYTSGVFTTNGVEGSNLKESAADVIVAGSNVDNTKTIGPVTVDFNSTILYTATNEIQLLDGFSAEQGSEFKAQIAGCPNNLNRTSDLSYINVNPDPDYVPLPPLLSDEEAIAIKQSNNSNLNDVIKIFPNPSNGNFKLILNTNNVLPNSLTILDSQGKILKQIENPNQYEYDFKFVELAVGLYLVNANYNDYVLSQKFIIK